MPASSAARSRAACLLLACAVLLQALWIPFHLASEEHLPIGGEHLVIGHSDSAPRDAFAARADQPDGRHPHSVLDHELAKEARTERRAPIGDDLGALPLALPPFAAVAIAPPELAFAAWPLPPPTLAIAWRPGRAHSPRAPPLG